MKNANAVHGFYEADDFYSVAAFSDETRAKAFKERCEKEYVQLEALSKYMSSHYDDFTIREAKDIDEREDLKRPWMSAGISEVPLEDMITAAKAFRIHAADPRAYPDCRVKYSISKILIDDDFPDLGLRVNVEGILDDISAFELKHARRPSDRTFDRIASKYGLTRDVNRDDAKKVVAELHRRWYGPWYGNE